MTPPCDAANRLRAHTACACKPQTHRTGSGRGHCVLARRFLGAPAAGGGIRRSFKRTGRLACYASVAGRMEEAKERLRDAINLDKDIRKLALDHQDLRPLWDWIAGLE